MMVGSLRRSVPVALVMVGLLAPLATARQEESSGPALGLKGYCPVCLIEMKQWVRGSADHQVEYDGRLYQFPSPREREMFLADPVKYLPVLHGDCVVCLEKMGERMPGNLRIGRFYQGRVYFFPSPTESAMFAENPSAFADADLALGGDCAVCLVEMGQRMPGKPEFTAHYQGMRYQFPGDEQRQMFLANPERYVGAASSGADDATIEQASNRIENRVEVEGRAGCAGCEHGISPSNDPDELGLAINAKDGTIYVVEGAHRDLPKLYEDRFDGGQLRLVGRELKREGKVVWVSPDSVEPVR